jgi:hypothetical protein
LSGAMFRLPFTSGKRLKSFAPSNPASRIRACRNCSFASALNSEKVAIN